MREAGFLDQPHAELDPALFEGGKMRDSAVHAIWGRLMAAFEGAGLEGGGEWCRLTAFGSGASYNFDPSGDLDIQVWVDPRAFAPLNPGVDPMPAVRAAIAPVNFASLRELGIPTDETLQYFVHIGEGTKREVRALHPYAAYDMHTGEWVVPAAGLDPEFYGDMFQRARALALPIADEAEGALAELARARADRAYWESLLALDPRPGYREMASSAGEAEAAARARVTASFLKVYHLRQEAYGPGGSGIRDERDAVHKLLEVWGIWPALDAEVHRKEGSYDDVRAKARAIRAGGGVSIIRLDPDVVVAEVRGDHGVYDSEVYRQFRGGAEESVTTWSCTCPWALYAWGRSRPYKHLEGRMCSHALATLYEAQSRENRAVSPHYRGPSQRRKPSPKKGHVDRGGWEEDHSHEVWPTADVAALKRKPHTKEVCERRRGHSIGHYTAEEWDANVDRARREGIVNPISIFSSPGDTYITDGQHRTQWAVEAGLPTVPVVVRRVTGKEAALGVRFHIGQKVRLTLKDGRVIEGTVLGVMDLGPFKTLRLLERLLGATVDIAFGDILEAVAIRRGLMGREGHRGVVVPAGALPEGQQEHELPTDYRCKRCGFVAKGSEGWAKVKAAGHVEGEHGEKVPRDSWGEPKTYTEDSQIEPVPRLNDRYHVNLKGKGLRHDDPRIPDEVYHVTTRADELERHGHIHAGYGGGLQGSSDEAVSMTTDRKSAEEIADDMRLVGGLARKVGPDPAYGADRTAHGERILHHLEGKARSEGWDYSKHADWLRSAGAMKDYGLHDHLNQYFIKRDTETGRPDPLFFGGEQYAKIDPARVGIARIPKRSLDNGAQLTDFAMESKRGLHEIRSYGDVDFDSIEKGEGEHEEGAAA